MLTRGHRYPYVFLTGAAAAAAAAAVMATDLLNLSSSTTSNWLEFPSSLLFLSELVHTYSAHVCTAAKGEANWVFGQSAMTWWTARSSFLAWQCRLCTCTRVYIRACTPKERVVAAAAAAARADRTLTTLPVVHLFAPRTSTSECMLYTRAHLHEHERRCRMCAMYESGQVPNAADVNNFFLARAGALRLRYST